MPLEIYGDHQSKHNTHLPQGQVLICQENSLLQSLGYPTRLGVPVLVIVDMHGRYVHTQGTGFLEYDPIEAGLGAQPLKVLAFLQHWREGSIRERQNK